MLRTVLLAVLMACAGPAQAWETKVWDTHGLHFVFLQGEAMPKYGITLHCLPEPAGLSFSAPASRDFAFVKGAAVDILLGDLVVPAELTANDSYDTGASADDVDLAAIIEHLGATGGTVTVGLAGMRNAEMTIPGDGWEAALEEFRVACGSR